MSRILVVFGGRSHEHPISCLSAATVVDALITAGHDVVIVGITRQGRWSRQSVPQAKDTSLPHVNDDAPTATLARLKDGVHLLTFAHDDATVTSQEPVDVVFPVLHGIGGEDGTIQGLCDTLGVAYVGADVAASALGVDKVAMKQAFAARNLPQVAFVPVTKHQFVTGQSGIITTIETTLDGPWFVKPACEGSSFGITRVTDASALADAISHAFTFGEKVIVEAAVTNARELEVGVIGYDDVTVTTPGEIVSAHTFYDFDAKYVTTSTLTIPADIPQDLATKIRSLATVAYRAIGCRGMARVDFFYTGTELYVNEINTIPGFTAHSMFPLLWAHEGWTFSQLVDRLVNDAQNAASAES